MSEEKSVEPMSQILSAEDLAYFRKGAEESEAEKGWPKEKKAALAMEDVMLILKSHEAVECKAKEAEAERDGLAKELDSVRLVLNKWMDDASRDVEFYRHPIVRDLRMRIVAFTSGGQERKDKA